MPKIDQHPSPENMAFASELIKARSDIGITQSQLAATSQVSLSAIKGYETGRNLPGARELRELCRALRVTPNKLLFGSETPFTPLNADDPAKHPGDKGLTVQRNRIAFLVNLLSFDESYAVYAIVHSIASARHGEKTVQEQLTGADLMTAIQRVSAGNAVDVDLLPKDPALCLELGNAFKQAAQEAIKGVETSGSKVARKVSKK